MLVRAAGADGRRRLRSAQLSPSVSSCCARASISEANSRVAPCSRPSSRVIWPTSPPAIRASNSSRGGTVARSCTVDRVDQLSAHDRVADRDRSAGVGPDVVVDHARRGHRLLGPDDQRRRAVDQLLELFQAGVVGGAQEQRVLHHAEADAGLAHGAAQLGLLGYAYPLVGGRDRDLGGADQILQFLDQRDLPFGGHPSLLRSSDLSAGSPPPRGHPGSKRALHRRVKGASTTTRGVESDARPAPPARAAAGAIAPSFP